MLSGVLVAASLLAAVGLQILNARSYGRLGTGAPIIIASLAGKPDLKASATTAAAPRTAVDKQRNLAVDVQQTSVVVVPGVTATPTSDGDGGGDRATGPRLFAKEGSAAGSGASAAEGASNSEVLPPPPDLDAKLTAAATPFTATPLDSYLNTLPTAPHSIPARPRNVILHEESAVIAALQRYSQAWDGRDVSEIIAVRPSLSRRTVRDELASTRAIDMSIRPTSTPRILGDMATVECEHRVTQTFRNGVQKQLPGVRMTYVLQKQGGTWVIIDTH